MYLLQHLEEEKKQIVNYPEHIFGEEGGKEKRRGGREGPARLYFE